MPMCINKRVVAGLAVVAVAVFVLSPRLLGTIGPVLIMAACPLSMLLLMSRMAGREQSSEEAAGGDRQVHELEEEVNRLKAELALRDQHRSA